jgi:aminoglycoside phosphotransferase (APT) family kinase protein
MDSRLIIDTALVRRLVVTQFPLWKGLAVRPVELGGWDNRTFHLGDEMTVRPHDRLWKVLITAAGHRNNQAEVEESGQVIGEVLADYRNSA